MQSACPPPTSLPSNIHHPSEIIFPAPTSRVCTSAPQHTNARTAPLLLFSYILTFHRTQPCTHPELPPTTPPRGICPNEPCSPRTRDVPVLRLRWHRPRHLCNTSHHKTPPSLPPPASAARRAHNFWPQRTAPFLCTQIGPAGLRHTCSGTPTLVGGTAKHACMMAPVPRLAPPVSTLTVCQWPNLSSVVRHPNRYPSIGHTAIRL
jgi:hypothetical protein